jgi:hypothetical protein
MDLKNTLFPVSDRRGSSQLKLKRKKNGTPRAPEVRNELSKRQNSLK